MEEKNMLVEQKNEQPQTIQMVADLTADWFLQQLVEMVNKNEGLGFNVTLNVGGFLVSGILAGGKEYFKGFGKEFSVYAGNDEEARRDLAESMAQWGKIYDNRDKEENPSPPTYIHLRDAKFFQTSGNPIPGNRGVWWRGRVSAVDGFILGTLSPAQD